MNMKMSVVVLSVAALAAPGATSYAKDKGQGKGKGKGRVEQSDQRSDRADHRDRRDRRDDDLDRDRDRRHDGDDKVTICHIPSGNRSNRQTITVGESAWEAHRGHGDHMGACDGSVSLPGSRFDRIDVNDDGVISRSEWTGDRGSFDRLDRNDDGVISRREYR